MKRKNETYKPKHNVIEYLKSIDVSSYNKHMELKVNDNIFSVIMITTITKNIDKESNSYIVYLLCADNNKNIITNEVLEKEFSDKTKAEEYYTQLLNQIKNNEIKVILK